MSTTKIEWANKVWNPVTGCTYGCEYCYARRMARRLQANPKTMEKYRNGFEPTFHPEECTPERMKEFKKGDMVFVGSMGDLFDPKVSNREIDEVLVAIVSTACDATFLFLTKQASRMQDYLEYYCYYGMDSWNSAYWGVSITNQKDADNKIPFLLNTTNAANKFISIEPMHGPIDLKDNIKGLNWVIVGGETGPNARPMHPDWVRSIREQCKEAGVPMFFKGWGEWTHKSKIPSNTMLPPNRWCYVGSNGHLSKVFSNDMQDGITYDLMGKMGKKYSGALLDGEMVQEFPLGLTTKDTKVFTKGNN